jgi:hypothetical protein
MRAVYLADRDLTAWGGSATSSCTHLEHVGSRCARSHDNFTAKMDRLAAIFRTLERQL